MTTEASPRTRQCSLDSKRRRENSHESFVSHRVNYCAHDSLLIPPPSNPAIQYICDTRISQQAQCPSMVVMEDEVADEGSCDESGERQEIREGVDVFV